MADKCKVKFTIIPETERPFYRDLENKEWLAENIPKDKMLIVHHETIKKWEEHFQEEGIDATIIPPDTRYGSLRHVEGRPIMEIITTPGLYVAPPQSHHSGVLIAVRPDELSVSIESKGAECTTPECGLFWLKDGLITSKIPPKRVLGVTKYLDHRWNPMEEIDKRCPNRSAKHWGCWVFTPNPKADKELVDCVPALGLNLGEAYK